MKDYVTLVTTSSKYEEVFTPEYLENLTFSELESLVLRINPNHRDYCVYSAGVVITAFVSNWGDTDNGQDIREDLMDISAAVSQFCELMGIVEPNEIVVKDED